MRVTNSKKSEKAEFAHEHWHSPSNVRQVAGKFAGKLLLLLDSELNPCTLN